MLKEIRCDLFSQPLIEFHGGLNVTLGDNVSTNSIGKSLFLLIIDYVFGGNSYVDSSAIKELGHHTVFYTFKFDSQYYYFSRDTASSDVMLKCDKHYNKISELKLDEFTAWLKEQYYIPSYLSFRSAVNPYSRIWGKNNYDVDKPLQNYYKDKESISVNNLVKLYELYDGIAEINKEIAKNEDTKKVLNGITKEKLIDKISNKEFKKNEIRVSEIENELENIKNNILGFSLNIQELSSKELIDLKIQKDVLIKKQSYLLNKMKRLELTLQNKIVKKSYFARLNEYFTTINQTKIEDIENFHNKIGSILNKEIISELKNLESKNEDLEKQIAVVELKIANVLENVDSPKFIVEKVYDLTTELNKIESVNKMYTGYLSVTTSIEDGKINRDNILVDILRGIEEIINTKLIEINSNIYTGKIKIPSINLRTNSYTFDHSSNTGTGKTYTNLIELDIAILSTSKLPFVIHDSILFKNIEDFTFDAIVKEYRKVDKQIFISIDGIGKFSAETQTVLNSLSVIKLSKETMLFNKNWQ